MPNLTVERLCIARGDRLLLRDLSFTVRPGEAMHIQGRNGVGKTTLLEALCGLRHQESGAVTERPEPQEMHWLGHRNALSLALSARENLTFWCGMNGADRAEVQGALTRLELQQTGERVCGRLSTGQKRRAALARLVAAPRPWWLLDEPLSGLDQAGVRLFEEILHDHLQGGGAAIFTSHQALGSQLPVRILPLA